MLNEQQETLSINSLKLLKAPVTVASKSEGACLMALYKYCDFKPEMGVNMQVPLDRYRRCDFKIDSTYIEYHPIVLQREFDSKYAQHRFNRTVDKLPKWAKHEVQGIMLNEFAVRYYNQRKLLIDVKHKGECDLVLATGAEEFYNNVIKRFAENPPSRKTFLDEFNHNRSKKGFNEVLQFFGAVKV
jgi:hypothetical protein